MVTKLKEVDAVVIGMGWTGSILSRELTKAGLNVVGLERGAMRTPRSSTTSRLIVLGIEARSNGRSSRTRSVVSMMLAFGCRLMMTSTEGLPLAIPALRRSSTESTTSAGKPASCITVMGRPLGCRRKSWARTSTMVSPPMLALSNMKA